MTITTSHAINSAMSSARLTELIALAHKTRKQHIQMHFEANSGHIGAGLSAIDVLVFLYSEWLTETRRFILSKGHAASALYATLFTGGQLTEAQISTYYKDGTLLPAHPAARAFEAIPFATGSLGHGLPIATGVAYANQVHHKNHHSVACLISDGECNEGSNWEAALFAGHHKLENLIVIIDRNGLQGFGYTKEVLDTEPLAKKWEAFGFAVQEFNGHDFLELNNAFKKLTPGKPNCLIAKTVKGKGISFMENEMSWHYTPITKEQYEKALLELDGDFNISNTMGRN